MTTLKPGAYPGLTEAEYKAIPAVRSSTLNAFLAATPAHYRYAQDQPEEDKPHHRWGRAFHLATFEPERFSGRVATRERMPTATELGYKDFRTKAAQEERKQKQAEVDAINGAHEAASRTLLDPDEMEEVTIAADNMRHHEVIAPLLEQDHEAELTLVWVDAATGLLCKARLDFWADPVAIELKSYRGIVTPDTVSREIARRGYHRQLGWYRIGIREALGLEVAERMVFLMAFSEKQAPYLAAVRPLETDAILRGQIKMADALKRFDQCKRSNRWPGVSSDGTWDIPDWCDGLENEITFGEPDELGGNLL